MSPNEIEELWKEYYPKVFGYFFRRVDNRQDVEDLTSLVLTAYLNALSERRDEIKNPHGYLWRIAHNYLVNFIKNKTKNPVFVAFTEDLEVIDESIEIHRSERFNAKTQDLMQCVKDNLPELDFKIVELIVMFDRKSAEVAEELNLTAVNVRQKLSRSLKKLKQQCVNLWELHSHI